MKGCIASLAIGFVSLGALAITVCADETKTPKYPIEQVGGTQLATAVGHYARTRSLLVTALREFDKARSKADPASLLDADLWRDTVQDRIEDLDRVLSPQPRATRDGVAFEPDSRLIGGGGQ